MSGSMEPMPTQFDPPSGTRDFLAAEFEARERAFAVIRSVFAQYGFEPLQTPAFERLDVLLGKYGEEGDKLIFKILRRGEHEASGEADLALRYDMTVPLARVAAAYGSQLPSPYKRYTIGPVWRADRPGRGRYREFTQCDLDTLGTHLGAGRRRGDLRGARRAGPAGHPRVPLPAQLAARAGRPAGGVRRPGRAGRRRADHAGQAGQAAPARGDRRAGRAGAWPSGTAGGAGRRDDRAGRGRTGSGPRSSPARRARPAWTRWTRCSSLVGAQIPAGRVEFTPRMVRGLSYYTGPIWEVVAPGVSSSIASGGRYDHLIEQLGGPDMPGTGGSLGVERILLLLPGTGGAARLRRLDVAVTIMGDEFAATIVRLRRRRPRRGAAGQRLPGRVRQARPPAQVGQRPGRPVGTDLRPQRAGGRHGHGAGHGQRRADRGPSR